MEYASERLKAFDDAHTLFKQRLYRDDGHLEPMLCKLHEAFGTNSSTSHNCLGCNFADITIAFDSVLGSLRSLSDTFASCSTYIFWLYLYVERYDQIMVFLSVPESYRARPFKGLQRIRRWANFIKHPKAFLFSHHPSVYHFGETGELTSEGDSVIISDAFVQEFYAGKEHNSKLAKMLSNKTDVTVIFPDPLELMQQFADDSDQFIQLIQNNEVYREELGKVTTVEGYYEAYEVKQEV